MRGNPGLKTGGDWKLDNVLSWLIARDTGIPGSCHGHESYFCMYGYSKKKKQMAVENCYLMLIYKCILYNC